MRTCHTRALLQVQPVACALVDAVMWKLLFNKYTIYTNNEDMEIVRLLLQEGADKYKEEERSQLCLLRSARGRWRGRRGWTSEVSVVQCMQRRGVLLDYMSIVGLESSS